MAHADLHHIKIRREFRRACAEYDLLEDGDRILVALSGGKDSLMLLRLMAEQARIHKPRIEVAAAHVVMDNIPYATEDGYLQEYCERLGVRLHVLHAAFDESTDKRKTKCFLCAWNRRKALFRFATEQGYTKVALGHHQDDFLVTWLLNITYEGSTDGMRPKMPMQHYPIQVIRPLCLVQEQWIREVAEREGWAKMKRLCPYETATRRTDMTRILSELESLNPEARYSMWHALFKK